MPVGGAGAGRWGGGVNPCEPPRWRRISPRAVASRAGRNVAGVARAQLEAWAREVGWETLLNRAGTTFRTLPERDKEGVTEKKAIALMMAQPSMIKRPVLDVGGKLLVGFKPDQYQGAFGARR